MYEGGNGVCNDYKFYEKFFWKLINFRTPKQILVEIVC